MMYYIMSLLNKLLSGLEPEDEAFRKHLDAISNSSLEVGDRVSDGDGNTGFVVGFKYPFIIVDWGTCKGFHPDLELTKVGD